MPDQQEIRELAYQKWEEDGAPQGNDGSYYWQQAEQELNGSSRKKNPNSPQPVAKAQPLKAAKTSSDPATRKK